jgi:hypothetical protein
MDFVVQFVEVPLILTFTTLLGVGTVIFVGMLITAFVYVLYIILSELSRLIKTQFGSLIGSARDFLSGKQG